MNVLLLLLCILAASNAAFYEKNSGVINLNQKNFDQLVKKENQVFLVEFYAPWCGHCKALKPEWEKAAKSLQGLVYVGAIDCDDASNKGLAATYGIQGFPTIKMFVGKSSPKDYNGARTHKAIADWALEHLPSHVKRVTDKNAEEFVSKDLHIPKALIFTKKKSTPPLLKSLSLKLFGKMQIGEVRDSDKLTVNKYGIGSFPAVLVFPKAEGGESGTSTRPAPVTYDGEIEAKPLLSFLKIYAGESEEADGNGIPQIHDQSCLKSLCLDMGVLCALLIPSATATKVEAKKHIDWLQQIRDKRDDSHFSYGWINVTEHEDFLSKAFGISPQEYAQMVVLSPKKNRYATFVGAYTIEDVSDFLSGVLRGSIKTFPLQSGNTLPSLTTTTSKCAPSTSSSKTKEQPKTESKSDSKPSGSSSEDGASVELTVSNFDSMVLQSRSAWMVEFFAPWCGHCKALAPEWKKAASSLKNMVKFGQIDSTVEAQLAQRYGIKGYPTIKVFAAGMTGRTKDNSVQDYQGPRTSQGLSAFALNLLPSNLVYSLSDGESAEGSLKTWFESTAPNNIAVRVLLFTNKASIPPLIKSLAVEFEGLISFAVAKESDHLLVRQFNVTTFPSLFVIRSSPEDTAKVEVIPWNAPMTYNHLITNFDTLTKNQRKSGGRSGDSSSSSGDEEPLVYIPKSAKEFNDLCLSKLGLCVLTFVSDEAKEEGGDKYQKILETVVEKERARSRTTPSPFRFFILSRSTQYAMADSWSVPIGPSSTVVLAPKKKRLALFVGVFDETALLDFLQNVKSGKGTFPIQTIPNFVDEPSQENQEKQESCGGNGDGENLGGEEGTCKKSPEKTKDEL